MKEMKATSPQRIGYILDQAFLEHRNPDGHPERPERLQAIMKMLDRFSQRERLEKLDPTPASWDLIGRLHTPELCRKLRESQDSFIRFDSDTFAGPASLECARLAAGAGIRLTEAVLEGTLEAGFALVRPPGHHAESNRSMGFCLLNNAALAAQFALGKQGIERVAVVDFDVHHGNGTQEIFYQRRDVLYISTHQSPLYPGTGAVEENGSGEGIGFTANFPLTAGLGDETYASLFADLVCPLLFEFKPDLILVSAGYDAHATDPLATMNMSAGGFEEITRQLQSSASELCKGRIVFFLEGGYALQALAESVEATFLALLTEEGSNFLRDDSDRYHLYRKRLLAHLGQWWPGLK